MDHIHIYIWIYIYSFHVVSGPVSDPTQGAILFVAFQSLARNHGIR